MNQSGCAVFFGVILASGCGSDARAPLEECEHGLYWADCGGNADPVLACDRDTGACRWFAGGDTARNHVVSDCPVADVCCHDDWPFTDFDPSGAALARAAEDVTTLRHGPEVRHAATDLTVSFELDSAEAPRIECSDPPPPIEGCGTGGAVSSRVGGSVVVAFPTGPYGEWLLEIVPGDPSSARLYFIRIGRPEQAPFRTCHNGSGGNRFGGTGTLQLNTDSLVDLDALHGRVDAETTEGSFTMTF